MKPTTSSALLLLSIAACDEKGRPDPDQEDQPDITVTPATVDFGDVPFEGAKSAAPPVEVTEVVEISNDGDADLYIEEVELDSDLGAYSMSAIGSVVLRPREMEPLAVTFQPVSAGVASGRLLVRSDDPDEPAVEIELLGTGTAPVIDVSPEKYDFGTLYIGCEETLPISISNAGDAALVVDRLDFSADSSEFWFDTAKEVNGSLPWTIQPEASVEVFVTYEPSDEYDDEAWLSIASNDLDAPIEEASQKGAGAAYAENTDLFQQSRDGVADIVFAVDRSESMSEFLADLQDNFSVYVEAMAALGSDFRIVAIVEDDGCVNGAVPYIDNTYSASDAQAAIRAMLTLDGAYGSNAERAFMLQEAFYGETAAGGCNEGTLRDDAALSLVGISDEPEQSVNSAEYYVTLFQSLKDDPGDVVFHAVGGDYPDGCGSAEAYSGYYEAVLATGGTFLSICSADWGAHLEALAEGASADRASFELTAEPVPETIEVRIDGLQSTVGWEYASATNSIDFDADYVPDGGSTIEVTYALSGECEE